MSRTVVFVVSVATFVMLSACSPSEKMADVTRAQSPLGFAETETAQSDTALVEQAVALRDMTATLKRKATIKGAAAGAVAGCGLSIVAGSGKSQCFKAAVAGGAVGGIAGHAAGERAVRERLELINLNKALPSLSAAGDQAELVARDVGGVLAAQDKELAQIKADVEAGRSEPAHYAARLNDIRTQRAALAEALSLSAKQAAEARALFEQAQEQGQLGLDWYLHAISMIEDDAISARAEINLL